MTAKRDKVILIGFLAVLLAAAAIFFYHDLTSILKPSSDARARTEYKASIRPMPKKITVPVGGRTGVLLRVKNMGTKNWKTIGKNPCFVSYHLHDLERRLVQYDNQRFPLPRTINPGETVEMEVTLRGPLKADKYILEFDLLREGVSWFKDLGSKTSEIYLQVTERDWPDAGYEVELKYGKYSLIESSIPEINTLFKLIRLTLEENEIEFNGKQGKVHGISAGKAYSQIWLRDANTIIPASRYFYDTSFLSSWLEEHLLYQTLEGSLYDWINAKGERDKNTTETDQESSAVQAAYQIVELLGASWLEKEIRGVRIIDRLERALEFVLNNRFHSLYGILTGAHTADWGDVDILDTDQEAVYVDERTHWTADIYDQSMFYQACLDLAEMLQMSGKSKNSQTWLKRAELIKHAANGLLWQPDKGFYRVHVHLDSLQHDFDEDEIFAMGGNTIAVLSGLTDEQKAKKIIENAVERQRIYGIPTISGTLLPPYPAGSFPHPMIDEPYEYQNGAQWDWFGGRLVYAMFKNGFSQLGREKLIEIIHKNIANLGFFEWDDPKGTGQGSDLFCGSAGVMCQALIQGYFGIMLGKDSLSLEPRLGEDSAMIHLYQPANDIYIAYSYEYDSLSQKVTFRYNTNLSKKGMVKILCPESLALSGGIIGRGLTVKMNGKNISPLIESMNHDLYLSFESELQSGLVEISTE